MHFQLTVIDREGKEWDVDFLGFSFSHIEVSCTLKAKKYYHELFYIFKNDPHNDGCLIKELSSPAEIKAWKEQYDIR